ncbi:hypothetical protein [Puniceicoccus vermicola]|uniref:PEP-CTERM sorting domain-containing protein n=1 Tax=Puniceicoccus vermicola TaxID=388746 RepID=A0A7X1E520_9BACT|nr:hypothetical protein [Puniceicoccus vermicola]MBC2602659.1 hypothetical protein [Puniceicoccus vermicola]
MKTTLTKSLVASLGIAVLPQLSFAAVQAVTAYTDDASISTGATGNGTYGNLTSVTIGGIQYTNLTGSTANLNISSSQSSGTLLGLWINDAPTEPPRFDPTGLNPANATDRQNMYDQISGGVSGLSNFEGAANILDDSFFQFDRTITAGDRIFIFDMGTGDDVTFELVDSIGNAIGDYTITLTAASFGGGLTSFDRVRTIRGDFVNSEVGTVTSFAGASFQLSDFSGTTGDLSQATGLRSVGNSNIDPSLIGLASIPEPSASAMIFGVLCGAAVIFIRRSKR